jgi:hypothetical protein
MTATARAGRTGRHRPRPDALRPGHRLTGHHHEDGHAASPGARPQAPPGRAGRALSMGVGVTVPRGHCQCQRRRNLRAGPGPDVSGGPCRWPARRDLPVRHRPSQQRQRRPGLQATSSPKLAAGCLKFQLEGARGASMDHGRTLSGALREHDKRNPRYTGPWRTHWSLSGRLVYAVGVSE